MIFDTRILVDIVIFWAAKCLSFMVFKQRCEFSVDSSPTFLHSPCGRQAFRWRYPSPSKEMKRWLDRKVLPPPQSQSRRACPWSATSSSLPPWSSPCSQSHRQGPLEYGKLLCYVCWSVKDRLTDTTPYHTIACSTVPCIANSLPCTQLALQHMILKQAIAHYTLPPTFHTVPYHYKPYGIYRIYHTYIPYILYTICWWVVTRSANSISAGGQAISTQYPSVFIPLPE